MKSPASGGVRFAPSPTGRFHVGNLRTAWISYKFAKLINAPWIVRFEDIDLPRVQKDARALQLKDLSKLQLTADLELLQSEFKERHWQCFVDGVKDGRIYPCDCSRKEVQLALSTMASAPHTSSIVYSGHCRSMSRRTFDASETLAWRFRMEDESGRDDFIVARTSKTIDSNGIPDFNSFAPSYHFACAIDDHDGNYDLLVRSSDLRESLFPQRALHKWLGRSRPIPVFHTSLVTQDDGNRLEKRTSGVTLEELNSKNITPVRLLEIFEKSFELPDKNLSIDRNFGEKLQAITLSNLGI